MSGGKIAGRSFASWSTERLAWDLGASAPGARRELIERARRGDPSVEPVLAERLRALVSPGPVSPAGRQPREASACCAVYAQLATVNDPAPLLAALERTDARTDAIAALARHAPASPRVALGLYAVAAQRDPVTRAHAIAALAVVAPSEPVLRELAVVLAEDRLRSTRPILIRAILAHARAPTLDAAAELLASRDPRERRGALLAIHATERPVDGVARAILPLCEPGTDTFVRRAAVRTLGRLAQPSAMRLAGLAELVRDWDGGVRAAAAVSLGQLAARHTFAGARFARAIEAIDAETLPDLAAAMRAGGPPIAPYGPLLACLARARGFTRGDLAGAILGPYRARRVADGVRMDGIDMFAWAGDEARLDELADSPRESERSLVFAELLALTTHATAAVRASSAVLAAQLEVGLGLAMVLTQLAAADPDAGVRAVAASLLERAVGSGVR